MCHFPETLELSLGPQSCSPLRPPPILTSAPPQNSIKLERAAQLPIQQNIRVGSDLGSRHLFLKAGHQGECEVSAAKSEVLKWAPLSLSPLNEGERAEHTSPVALKGVGRGQTPSPPESFAQLRRS